MATKKLKKKVQRKPAARKTQNPVVDSAREVWLAGLGALATAGAEGEKLFDALVRRGEKLEKQVEGPVGKASAKVRGTVKQARARATTRICCQMSENHPWRKHQDASIAPIAVKPSPTTSPMPSSLATRLSAR